MKKLLLAAGVLFVLALVAMPTGCVKMDQDLTLNADGSSLVKIHYAMREEHVKQMEAIQAMGPGMPGAGTPGVPGTPPGPDMARMQEMIKKLQEMQKNMPARHDGTPMVPMDMQKLAEQIEAMRKGKKPPATGTTPAVPEVTVKPEKSIEEQVEDLKKSGQKDPDLKVKKPRAGAMSEEMRKEIEKMKAAARKEAAIGKGEKRKPEVPKVEKPGKVVRPTGPLPAGGAAGMGGLLFDEKAIRRQFAGRKADGVELREVKVVTKDGWRHAYITSACKDLGSATRVPAGGGRGGTMGLTKDSDGNYVMVIAHPQLGRMSGSTGDDKAEHERARKSMPGFRMSVKVTVPGDIVKTNAHKSSGRTASWVLDIDDAEFPRKCRALNSQGMSVTFKGAGLKLKTFKPTVVQ